MTILSFYSSAEQINAAISYPPGTVFAEQTTQSTLMRFGAANYSETYLGQGLATSGGNFALGTPSTWVAGTITSFEVRNQEVLLLKFENFSIQATEFNKVRTQGATAFSLLLNGSDTINGSPYADILGGLGGNDFIFGGAGNDLLFEDNGNDLFDGGSGVDTLEAIGIRRSEINLTRLSSDSWSLGVPAFIGSNTLRNIEYLKLSDSTVSLLDLALGSPAPLDLKGTQVYRFAKTDSGQYFYTGDIGERNLIIATLNNFRYEGPVFNAQDNWVTNYNPVYRFANLLSGGYFYTSSAAERDTVFSDYAATYRYEGASFFVPASATADTIPVYRLANVKTGGYLFTANASERQFAQSLGFFRDEGVAFNAPRTISLAFDSSDEIQLSNDFSAEISNAGNAVISQFEWFV